MRYMLMIYGNEADRPVPGTPQAEKIFGEYFAYGEEVTKAGVFKAGDALLPSGTATTVRVRDGKSLTTDGPFAETKEQLGGFYILDCKDLDEALKWAAKIPDARIGAIEVRPLMEFSADMQPR
jgi:hypothetical protein